FIHTKCINLVYKNIITIFSFLLLLDFRHSSQLTPPSIYLNMNKDFMFLQRRSDTCEHFNDWWNWIYWKKISNCLNEKRPSYLYLDRKSTRLNSSHVS